MCGCVCVRETEIKHVLAVRLPNLELCACGWVGVSRRGREKGREGERESVCVCVCVCVCCEA